MKRIVRLAALVSLVAVAGGLTAAGILDMKVDAYAVEVSIAPSAQDNIQLLERQTPFTYTCNAVVLDAATKVPIGTATAIVAQGSSEAVTTKSGPWTTTLTVKLGRKAMRADIEVVVEKDDKIVTRQFTRAQLQNVDPGIVPLR